MQSAENVRLWDPETQTTVKSQRLYLTHEVSASVFPFEGFPQTRSLALYEDEATGLVTADVAKFERLMSLILKK